MGRDATDNLSAAFATATAEATGRDERTIRRAAARGEALGADLDAVTGTSLDKGVELDALAKMAPEERVLAAAEEQVTFFLKAGALRDYEAYVDEVILGLSRPEKPLLYGVNRMCFWIAHVLEIRHDHVASIRQHSPEVG